MDRSTSTPALECEFELPTPYNLGHTMSVPLMGSHDPIAEVTSHRAALALPTEAGPVTVAAEQRGSQLRVQLVGLGADWMLPRVPAMFGLLDRPAEFQPTGRMSKLVRHVAGMHLPRLPVVFPRLIQIVLQQLVSWADAFRSWRLIVDRYGRLAPALPAPSLGAYVLDLSDLHPSGPRLESRPLRLPPTAATLRKLAYYDLVECGVLPKQARLVLRLAGEANRIERLAQGDPSAFASYLKRIPGMGDWTIQYLLGSALGQPDATLTGDYNMPHTVSYFLTGVERSDDARMLELLEPFRGHRFRVVMLLWRGRIQAPRRGARMPSNRWRFREMGGRRP